MKSSTPLHGIELVDCAQANAKLGLATAAKQCGYGENLLAFQKELKRAGNELGIQISSLEDLTLEPEKIERTSDFSPDTFSQL
jgi:hypothetical protein